MTRADAKPQSPLIVRRDDLFCTICHTAEPISPGDGVPLDAYMVALEYAKKRHPPTPHADPFMEGLR